MPIAAIEIIHAESVGFSPEFNLKRFRIVGRSTRQTAWRTIVEVNHDKPVARERIVFPGTPTLVELRIEIIEPSFMPDGNVVRVAEIFTWSTQRTVR